MDLKEREMIDCEVVLKKDLKHLQIKKYEISYQGNLPIPKVNPN